MILTRSYRATGRPDLELGKPPRGGACTVGEHLLHDMPNVDPRLAELLDSVQVMRRMAALINDLIAVAPEERRPSIRDWETRLQLTIARSFATADERSEASTEDRQGLGSRLRGPWR